MAWLTGWNHRKKLTIDNTYVDADLSNFPLYVKIYEDTQIASAFLTTGNDFRFTQSDGSTTLSYEIESLAVVSSACNADIWVKVPAIDDIADTDIYLYYGNATASAGVDPTNVWDANFKAVWHLKDITTSTIEDSTASNYDGTKKGADEPVEATGIVGKGQTFDGSDDNILVTTMGDFGTGLDTTYFYFSGWFKSSNTTVIQALLGTLNTGATTALQILQNTIDGTNVTAHGMTILRRDADNMSQIAYFNPGSGVCDGSWHHISIAQNNNSLPTVYLDTVLKTFNTSTNFDADNMANLEFPMALGSRNNRGTVQLPVNGTIDEFRMGYGLRTAAWIKFEYNNMASADQEVAKGSEETVISPTLLAALFNQYAPTIGVGGDITVTPDKMALILTQIGLTLRSDTVYVSDLFATIWSRIDPTYKSDVQYVASVFANVLTQLAPTLSGTAVVSPNVLAGIFTNVAPSITYDYRIALSSVLSVTLGLQTATVSTAVNVTLLPDSLNVLASLLVPAITADMLITIAAQLGMTCVIKSPTIGTSTGRTYIVCSSTSPAQLDIYVAGNLVASFFED
jgi:hypothetical protein